MIGEAQTHANRINAALATALAQYEETMGEAFPTVPRLKVVDDPNFWASADLDGSRLTIAVTTGLVGTLTGFWDRVADLSANTDAVRPLPVTPDEMVSLSLIWLMLHELHHFQMGHFEITGQFCLTEAKEPNAFGVATRASSSRPPMLAHVGEGDLAKVEPCLEMQADHDAIEMLLDAYSTDGWDAIHARTMAIAAMMVLIEREDSKRSHALSSHPKAATRIFQLLGHVMEMPLIQARLAAQRPELNIDPTLPSDEEQSAFNHDVVIPAILGAQMLAQIAGADSIIQDIGEPQDFFQDTQIAKLVDPEGYDALTTAGAKQWAELVGLNGQLMRHER